MKLSLARYGEVKSLRPVTHKGYGLSKFKVEMVLTQDIPSRIAVQGNHLNVFYRNQPRSCFVCTGAGHEAKNCPKKAANKRPAPVDTTRAVSNKAPPTRMRRRQLPPTPLVLRLGIQLQTPLILPPPMAFRRPSLMCFPPPLVRPLRRTTRLPGTPQLALVRRLSPARIPSTCKSTHMAPTIAAMEVTEQSAGPDPPSSNSSSTADPPALAVPVPLPHGTESTTDPPPSTEQHIAPVIHTEDPSQLIDTFPNLEHFFDETPRLHSRPDVQDSSSSSASSVRSKRCVSKKTKATHMSSAVLGAGIRKRTTPQAVCGTKKKPVLTQNQYEILSDALNDEAD